MPKDLIMIFWIGGILYILGTPLIIWLLLSIKEKLKSLMSFREWFMTAYDFNEKIIDAIDSLDKSLKKRFFELSLQHRDRLKEEVNKLKKDLINKKEINVKLIISQLLDKLEQDDSKDRKNN